MNSSTRPSAIFSLVLSAVLLPLGCGPTTPSTADPNATKPSDTDKAAAEAKAKRDAFVQEMQKQLDELDAKYRALEKRAAEAKGDARKELDEKVKVAKARRDVAARKLDELKTAGHDRWEKVKEGVGSAFDDLKKVFE